VDKLKESLALLMLSHVDLYATLFTHCIFVTFQRRYLMHSPGAPGAGRADSWAGRRGKKIAPRVNHVVCTAGMEDCVGQGLARSIGVSNYGTEHLKARDR
jgi:diketogulonate reductase-like aldo/keto reductase